MEIITLGPQGSYSHQAASTHFNPTKLTFANSITEVFETVKNNKNLHGVVPLENIIEGTVRETFDQLYETDLKVINIASLEINHCLLAPTKDFDTILSHPQALAQCRKFLHKYYKKHKLIPVNSTSQACLLASQEKNCAAISSKFTGEMYQLNCLHEDIADYSENKTNFALIGHKSSASNHQKSLAALTPINSDQPGLLVKMLYPFQENQVNLSKIESRPNKLNLSEHVFFIEFEGDFRQARARKTFTYLEKDLQICKVKILGGQLTTP